MPFKVNACNFGGNLEQNENVKVENILHAIDKRIVQIAQEKNFSLKNVRLYQPIHYAVVVSQLFVEVFASNKNASAFPYVRFIDHRPNFISNATDVKNQLEEVFGFDDIIHFMFPTNWLNGFNDDNIFELANNYIQSEINRIDKMNKIVKINPIFKGRDFFKNDNLYFVLSPFKDPFNIIFNDHIKPTIEQIPNSICLRADNIYGNKPIIEDIWKSINEAKIIIAELTDRNPNVFYEVGVAHTVGKEVILITQSMDDVPFDLKHLRCIVYEYTPRGCKMLEDNLTNTIRQIIQ
jgi:hypothetical protein